MIQEWISATLSSRLVSFGFSDSWRYRSDHTGHRCSASGNLISYFLVMAGDMDHTSARGALPRLLDTEIHDAAGERCESGIRFIRMFTACHPHLDSSPQIGLTSCDTALDFAITE